MNAAAQDAVLLHKQLGLPMVVWRDGKVVWVSPDEDEGQQGTGEVTCPKS